MEVPTVLKAPGDSQDALEPKVSNKVRYEPLTLIEHLTVCLVVLNMFYFTVLWERAGET